MGSDAEIYIFDHKIYIEEVVPDFQHYLLTSQAKPWLQELIENPHIDLELNRLYNVDLVRFCTYLSTRDLSWNHASKSSSISWGWKERACYSRDCPERANCPYHLNNSNTNPGELNRLFEVAVCSKCLSDSQFVGRSADINLYDKLLRNLGVDTADPIHHLLHLLSRRGFIIGYQWSNSDGIHGWLNHDETKNLFQRLDALDLPRYEVSFSVMSSFNSKHGYQHPQYPWDALSLSFIRTVAYMAIQVGKGILWGNDLMSPEDYN